MQTDGALTINGCTFTNNNAKVSGGAVGSAAGGSTTILNSNLTGNKATDGAGGGGSGGAIARLNGGTLTISNSTIANNAADTPGGGIATQGGKVSMMNSTLSNNSARRGGGLVTQTIPGAQDDIENCTISGNVTTDTVNGRGGGLAMFGFESGFGYTKFTLRNCTVTNNT